jgi:predicted proteasome-type protease
MKSNVTVGPPIDLLIYAANELDVTRQRKFPENDPDLIKIRTRWQQALRQAVARLPNIRLAPAAAGGKAEGIEVVEGEDRAEGAPQMAQGKGRNGG